MRPSTIVLVGVLVACSWLVSEPSHAQADATLRSFASPGNAAPFRQKASFSSRETLAECPSIGISCGDNFAAQLTNTDCNLKDGSFADTYFFSGVAGETVTITMTSKTFDTFLYLNDPFGSRAAANDDFSGLGNNSRIIFTLTATGVWSVQATSLSTATVGDYNLALVCDSSTICASSGALTCGVPINGSLSTTDCVTGTSFVDFYDFNATAGVPVTFSYSAPGIPLLLTIQDSGGGLLASKAGSGSVSLTYTSTFTGRYVVGVTSSQAQATGPYTLSAACGAVSCAPGATALCLNNGRFRVTAAFQSSVGSGSGQAVPLTSDTGYFWFFTGTNVEMVVKVVNGCSFNSRYWTFAGGLTDVGVTLTVIDTQDGTAKTYVNPVGKAFLPIQDTVAFSRCP